MRLYFFYYSFYSKQNLFISKTYNMKAISL